MRKEKEKRQKKEYKRKGEEGNQTTG